MRTIGRRWPSDAPRGDYVTECSYCGVAWQRSKLRKDAAGNLVCPNEGNGRDAVTLSELNAAAGAEYGARMGEPIPVDGSLHMDDDEAPAPFNPSITELP